MDLDRRRRWEERHRSSATIEAPSRFVVEALALLGDATSTAPGAQRALDLACGRGRHALLLAERGYRVDAVDYAVSALTTLKRTTDTRGLDVRCFAADVTAWPLPPARYALVLVVNFLERSLFAALRTAVAPGGALLYETYRRDEPGRTATALRPDFLLAPGELDEVYDGWRVLSRREETTTHDGTVVARAGILVQRPIDPSSAAAAH
jgi:SAM-dependent methyltransferase